MRYPTRTAATFTLAAIAAASLHMYAGSQEDSALSVDRSKIALGQSVTLKWALPDNVESVYISSLDNQGATSPSARAGVRTVIPSASTAYVLLAQTPAGVLVRTAHVTVTGGARGSGAPLNPEDLGCRVTIALNRSRSLDFLLKVRAALESRDFSVEHEFVRGSDFVLQTKPGGHQSPASGSVRQVIHQVSLGLNLVGSAAGSGAFTSMLVGSQLRFRRAQEAEWQVDTDNARCFSEVRSMEQALGELLKQ